MISRLRFRGALASFGWPLSDDRLLYLQPCIRKRARGLQYNGALCMIARAIRFAMSHWFYYRASFGADFDGHIHRQIGLCFSVLHRVMMHTVTLKSTQEARVALCYSFQQFFPFFCAFQTSTRAQCNSMEYVKA